MGGQIWLIVLLAIVVALYLNRSELPILKKAGKKTASSVLTKE